MESDLSTSNSRESLPPTPSLEYSYRLDSCENCLEQVRTTVTAVVNLIIIPRAFHNDLASHCQGYFVMRVNFVWDVQNEVLNITLNSLHHNEYKSGSDGVTTSGTPRSPFKHVLSTSLLSSRWYKIGPSALLSQLFPLSTQHHELYNRWRSSETQANSRSRRLQTVHARWQAS